MTVAVLMAFGVSWGVCLLLVPFVCALAFRIRLLDLPDGRRKVHVRPIPAVGGIAIFLAGSLTVAGMFLVSGPLRDQLVAPESGLTALFLAAVVICLVGIADDYGCLRGRQKLAGQCLSVAIVVWSGLVVRSIHLFGWDIELGLLAVPFTFLWLLGTINALNLLDGMDGLLGSVGLILCLALAGMAVILGQWPAACVACALAGALLGFLRFNLPPASIFLGDCGSMLIGLVVGVLALRGAMTGPDTCTLLTPMALLTIPFLDTAAAILRRKLTGRSIYTTDRGHLHHCLLRRGWSRWSVLLLVGLLCLLAATGALGSLWWRNELFAVLGSATVVIVLVTTRLFGHTEWVLLRKWFLALLASLVSRQGHGKGVEARLQGSAAWQDVWNELLACAHRLGLVSARFNVNAPAIHECYHAHWACPVGEVEEANLWRADIPLVAAGQTVARLEVSGRRDHQPVAAQIADIAKLTEQFARAVSEVAEIATLRTKGGDEAGARRETHPTQGRPHLVPHFARVGQFHDRAGPSFAPVAEDHPAERRPSGRREADEVGLPE